MGQTSTRGHAPGLEGISGRVLLKVAGAPVGVLKVERGEVEFTEGETQADATVAFADGKDVARLLRGELNPMVAVLQDRMEIEGGNVALVAKVALGLRVGSPFSGARIAQGG